MLVLATLLSACSEGSEDSSAVTDASTDANESVASDAESTEPDTEKPSIRIPSGATEVIIDKGEEYDLMQNVTGYDKVDGIITDKIQINDGGFDPSVVGEYTVTYFLADNAGNAADPKFKKITVRETDVLAAPPVWEGEIEGEKLNPKAPAVFGGAWYHKAVSSKDKWIGIEATVTLPEVTIRRYDGEYDDSLNFDPNVKNLDNPSVYMGGNASSESDVGLSFSRALIDTKSNTLSTGCIAFRPFWRYITDKDQDLGGYDAHGGEYAVSANGNNCIANYHWKYTEYYYLPGDKIRMVVYIPEEGKMQLQIEVLEVSTLPESVAMREKYGWKDPADFLSPIFAAPGHGTDSDAEFKRVNAIDQVSNEGGTAIFGDTLISNIIWHETYLYREIDGTLYRVPMSEDRRGVTNAPKDEYFDVDFEGVDSDLGGERVTIHPGYKNK